MAQLMDHITYLSKEIGPRPAGTEEEQNAALYITEQFQKETGFTASMEDFSSSSNVEAGLAVMAGVVVVATVLAMIFPVLSLPAFILAAAAAAVYSLEEFDKPIISRVLSRGASQNVVAKYVPSADSADATPRRGSSRKVILMAHYDTGNVTPPIVERLERSKAPIALICVAGIIAAAFFLLIRIFVAGGGGMGLLVLNVLATISILVCLYPIVKAVLIRTSPYNEGATNNATGTAALIEIARRIAHGSISEAELADTEEGVVIHGEEAARQAGLIPEGVQLVYEVEEPEPVVEVEEEYDEESEEERLLSAKAAIAALTGKPVESKIYTTITPAREDEAPREETMGNLGTDVDYQDADNFSFEPSGTEYVSEAAVPDSGVPSYSSYEAAESVDGFQNAPGWFVAAQQNARRPEGVANEANIKRSRYTEAIENAERGLAEREEEMRAAERAAREAAQRAREEELRASLAAREEERRAAVQPAQVQPEGESVLPIIEETVSPQVSVPAVQSPDDTAVFTAHTPAAEIIAEALAADRQEAQVAQPAGERVPQLSAESIPSPRVSLDASAIPVPPQDQTAHNRISALPSIDPSNPYTDPAPAKRDSGLAETLPPVITDPEPSKSGILRKIRTNIPSLSGLISPVSTSPSSGSSRGQAEKVDYGMEVNLDNPAAGRAAASAGNGAVEIPRSRSGSLLNKLRHADDEALSDTPQQWLDVEDDFDPRAAGRDRGGWESFRSDDIPAVNGYGDNAAGNGDAPGRRWEGGAYSRMQLGYVDTRSGEDAEADTPIAEEPFDADFEKPITDEIEQIYHFRNPLFSTEVWFVAVGSDGVSHDGARAFIEEHRDELRGSMMIEIESLGAGELSFASEEGRIRKTAVSSRVKRFTRAATAETGVAVSSVSLVGTDSIASTLQKAGYQAMHVFGAEDGRPALKGSADDVVENVDEVLLEEHIGFVYELLKR